MATGMALIGAPPVAADEWSEPQEVEVTVVADDASLDDGYAAVEELAEVGVSDWEIEQIADGVDPWASQDGYPYYEETYDTGDEEFWDEPYQGAAGDFGTLSSTSTNYVEASWGDKWGRDTPLRGRASGKVAGHNLRPSSVRNITQYPREHTESGTRNVFSAPAFNIRCRFRVCYPIDGVNVVVIVDRRDIDGRPFGVVTAYCENPDRSRQCPNYVKEALNG